jgi:Protein of unknown function (DUF1579)
MHATRMAIVAGFLLYGMPSPWCLAQDKKDPQSTVEPRAQPGVGQKFLEKFVGDWDVVKTFYSPKGAGTPARTEGRCRQTMVQGGRFLQSDFTFGGGDKATTGMGLIGYETQTGRFTSVWVDSRQTKMSLRQSKDAFNGEEIVLFSKALGDEKGRSSRTVTRLEDGGRRIVHRQYNAGTDGQERLLMELVLTRTNRPAPGARNPQ